MSSTRLCLFALSLLIGCRLIAASDSIEVTSIKVHPTEFRLNGKREQLRLIVTGMTTDGQQIDLTGEATFAIGDASVADCSSGVITPKADGKVVVTARFEQHQAESNIDVANVAQSVSFDHHVLPILARTGCSGGACHGSPNGKAGFRLSLFGSGRDLDANSIARELFARRVNLLEPEKSLLLRKPTTQVAHQGGKRLDLDSYEYQLLKDWIASGCETASAQSHCVEIDVHPPLSSRVKKFPYTRQQLSVLATFDDGTVRDVTHLANYVSSDSGVAEVQQDGLVVGLGRGHAAIIVRYGGLIATPLFTFVRDVDGFAWNDPQPTNYVDATVYEKLRQLKFLPAEKCGDSEFIRRLSLDVLGILPTPNEVRAFVADSNPNKREALLDSYLLRPEYAKFWAQKWGDLLRVSTKLIGTSGVYKYSRWLEHSVGTNQPYDQFAKSVLLSSGSTRQHPAGNFYRSAADTSDTMETAAQVFLGTRIQCAKCHNHPFERWTQDNYYGLATFFGRVQRSRTNDESERVVWSTDSGEITHPGTGEHAQPWLPGNPNIESADGDRRYALADWLTADGKTILARVEVNRIWTHLLGRGIVEPFDDFRDSNPPSNAALLDALAKDFIEHDFDRQHILRTIVLSNTYQASSRTTAMNREDTMYFSHYMPRMLTAEQLVDALGSVTGRRERFFGVPEGTLATWLPAPDLKPHDRAKIGEIELLKVFGQPERQSACECERGDDASLGQALQLFNGEFVHQMLSEKSNDMHKMLASGKEPVDVIAELYLRALSREPTESEKKIHEAYLHGREDMAVAMEDLCWTLLNHTEFLFQH